MQTKTKVFPVTVTSTQRINPKTLTELDCHMIHSSMPIHGKKQLHIAICYIMVFHCVPKYTGQKEHKRTLHIGNSHKCYSESQRIPETEDQFFTVHSFDLNSLCLPNIEVLCDQETEFHTQLQHKNEYDVERDVHFHTKKKPKTPKLQAVTKGQALTSVRILYCVHMKLHEDKILKAFLNIQINQ